MLRIQNLSKVFNRNTVNENTLFEDLNFTVNKGDFITIIGSNGAGKSTLLNIISGSIEEDEGSVMLNGKELCGTPEYKRSKHIGRVFQDTSKGVALDMTILENLSMAYNKGKSFNLALGISKKNISLFKELLAELNLGLENKLHTKVKLLSGGQRQALCLVMAVMGKPELLLLDEHTAALDPKTSEKIIKITEKIVGESNITTMMVTHNLNHAIGLGNRLIMMHSGNVVLDIEEKEKRELTVNKLLEQFDKVQGKEFLGDRVLFS